MGSESRKTAHSLLNFAKHDPDGVIRLVNLLLKRFDHPVTLSEREILTLDGKAVAPLVWIKFSAKNSSVTVGVHEHEDKIPYDD